MSSTYTRHDLFVWNRYGEVIDELPIVPGSDRALISPDSRMREAAGRGDYPSVVAFLVSPLASSLSSTVGHIHMQSILSFPVASAGTETSVRANGDRNWPISLREVSTRLTTRTVRLH